MTFLKSSQTSSSSQPRCADQEIILLYPLCRGGRKAAVLQVGTAVLKPSIKFTYARFIYGGNVRISKKSVLVAVLALISLYLTLYTWKAHSVAAQHICGDPGGTAVTWRTGPSGSLFPWPREPGMLEILSRINEVDLFIYRYLIKSRVLVGSSILLWICTGVFAFKAIGVNARIGEKEWKS